jgi:hypothetical protein
MISDNAALRHAAAAGMLAGVVGPPGEAVHSSRGAPGAADLMRTFVELGMLARARCLVISFSGFSNAARWWGGQTCVVTVDTCVTGMAALPTVRGSLPLGDRAPPAQR